MLLQAGVFALHEQNTCKQTISSASVSISVIQKKNNEQEENYGNVHITMANGGPAIELCCEPEESEDEGIEDVGQLNGFLIP